MCPLRYILLLLSLLVAMIGFSQAMAEADQISHVPHEEEEEENTVSKNGRLSSSRKPQSTFRTLVDMLNGKYLYDAWRATQSRSTLKTA
ncbi:hypothetical protein P43SY_005968 [Pythium insidiosum]|uniref:RxLR effector protein n=1 Tax=Pythium insidiosum TaxID=114742 RepID=A0AAD5LTK3_PYTIN|nr:hypothetical protein P43SY_005968 [Pythium insidiosum]